MEKEFMLQKRSLWMSWVMLGLSYAPLAYGNGFYAPLYSANQLGVSGAALTMPRFADIAAINPAGMAWLAPGWHLSAGALGVTGGFDWKGTHPDTGAAAAAASLIGGKMIPHFQLVNTSAAPDKLSYGLAIKTPYANGSNWPKNWAGRELGSFGEIAVLSINPNVAYALDKEQAIAVGLGYASGFANARLTLRAPHLINEVLAFAGQDLGTVITEFSGHAMTWNAAYLGTAGPFLIGVHGTSPLTMSLKGTMDYPEYGTAEMPLPGFNYQDLSARLTMFLPWILEIGIGWKDDLAHPTLELELGWLRGGWSTYKEVITDLAEPDEFSARSPTATKFKQYENSSGKLVRGATQLKEPRHYRDANTYRLGMLWHFHEAFSVMAGVSKDESVVPPQYREPMMAIGESNGYSVGLEWGINNRQSIGIESALIRLRKNSLSQTRFLVTDGTPVDIADIAADPGIRRIPFNGNITGSIMIIGISYNVSF